MRGREVRPLAVPNGRKSVRQAARATTPQAKRFVKKIPANSAEFWRQTAF